MIHHGRIYENNEAIEGSDLEVGDTHTDLSEGPNSRTDIDANVVDGEITVNGRTLDSPSVESKNYNPAECSDFLVRSETADLIDKFVRQAESRLDKDSFVLVTTSEYRDKMSDLGQIQRLRNSVQAQTSSDVEIEITTYGELES